ncbi:MAG: acyltransferase family protein [Acidimicrobiales bacterium]
MPRPVEGREPYNPGLDGIRALAILGVIAYHLGFGWAGGGLLGVGVFFVLSGYLITDLLVAEYRRRTTIQLGQFWLRRARRLLPALFVMLFVVAVWATLFNRGQLPDLRSDMLPAIFYMSNWWFIFHHVSYFAAFGPPSPLGHLWSLAVEEQFYVFWPIVMLGALRWVKSQRVIVIGILLLAAGSAIEMAVLYSPVTDPTRVYDGTDTRAFALLIGAALALVLPRSRSFFTIGRGARRCLEAVSILSITGIVALYAFTSQYDPFVYRGGMVLLSVFTALLIAICVHPGTRVGAWLGVEPLRWIGERSYAIYLWQYPVIINTTPQGASASYPRAALQVASIIGISALSWHFIEQPVRHGALGRSWARAKSGHWWRYRPTATAAALVGVVVGGLAVASLGLAGAVNGATAAAGHQTNVLPPKRPAPPAPSQAVSVSDPVPGTTTTTSLPPAGQGVTAIGDSIMIDLAPVLQQLLPGIIIDGQVGQQLYQVQSQVAQLKAAGDIGNRLIIELGTNGYYSVAQLDELLSALGPMQRIVLVNTRVDRPWEQPVNQTIAAVAQTHPNTTVVDWYDASADDPGGFQPDGIHLTPQGAQFLAGLIVHALEEPPPTSTAPPSTTTTRPKARGAASSTRR